MGLRADSACPQRVSGSARADSRRTESARNPIALHVKFGDDSALGAFTRTQWTAAFSPRAGEMIPEVGGGGGTRPWGPRGKGSVSVSKGPKPPIQLLQLLKNSPREAKRVHFRYILVHPGSHPGNEINGGPEGKVPPAPLPPVSPAMLSPSQSVTVRTDLQRTVLPSAPRLACGRNEAALGCT